MKLHVCALAALLAGAAAPTVAAPPLPIVEWDLVMPKEAPSEHDRELVARYHTPGAVAAAATGNYTDHLDNTRGTARVITVDDLRIPHPNGYDALVTMHFFLDPNSEELLFVSSGLNEQWTAPNPANDPRANPLEILRSLENGIQLLPLEGTLTMTIEEALAYANAAHGMRWDVGQLVLRQRSVKSPFPAVERNGEFVSLYPAPVPAWLVQSEGDWHTTSHSYCTGKLIWVMDRESYRSEGIIY